MNFFDPGATLPSTSASDSSGPDETTETEKKRKRDSEEEVESGASVYAGPPERRKTTDALGRVRKFPHVEGNFASLVYIPGIPPSIPSRLTLLSEVSFSENFQAELQQLCTEIEGELGFEVHALWRAEVSGGLDLHISLSRSFSLTFPQIETFLALLRKRLKKAAQESRLEFGRLKGFVPDDSHRTFLAVAVASDHTPIHSLIKAVDDVMLLHEKEPFHKDPQPHASVGWVLGNHIVALEPILAKLAQPARSQQQVTSICCRIGQKNHIVWSSTDTRGQ